MKRALLLSITALLLPIATAVAAPATGSSPLRARYSLVHFEAAPAPTSATRYQVTTVPGAATTAGRFHLLGTGADASMAETCGSVDALFASGFEN